MTSDHIPSSALRDELASYWREADRRHQAPDADASFADVLRWKEKHDREREERLYLLVDRCSYRGTLRALLVFGAVLFMLWIAAAVFLFLVGAA